VSADGGAPLLVTGMPRTATSWVGKMLEASGALVYVNEPLNPQHPPGRSPGVLRADVEHAFQYISEENERDWLPAFRDTVRLRFHPLAELRRNHRPYDVARTAKYATGFGLGRLRGRRALLDDPYAVFAAPWLARRVGCRVVVTVRDPVATVSSWQRLGWTPRLAELETLWEAGPVGSLRSAAEPPVNSTRSLGQMWSAPVLWSRRTGFFMPRW
jgi:Sulfotransferase family